MSENQAERYKAQGNAALQARNFDDAVDLYSRAIALDPSNAVYFSNRAAAHAALGRFQEALDDSFEVTSLRPEWVKGWVRRGGALAGLGKHEEARKAYLKASQLDSGNADVQRLLEEAERAAAKTKDRDWEKDLWSDEDEDEDEAGGGAAASKAAAAASASGHKRAAPPHHGDDAHLGPSAPKRRRPDPVLAAKLDRSLKDASEDTLRACLGQLAGADEQLADKALHLLEGLNAASSAGEDDDD